MPFSLIVERKGSIDVIALFRKRSVVSTMIESRPMHREWATTRVQPFGGPCPNNVHILPTIDMQILVITADGNEANLPAIKQTLEYLGTPYTIYIATQTPGGLTPDKLGGGSHGYYQGI